VFSLGILIIFNCVVSTKTLKKVFLGRPQAKNPNKTCQSIFFCKLNPLDLLSSGGFYKLNRINFSNRNIIKIDLKLKLERKDFYLAVHQFS